MTKREFVSRLMRRTGLSKQECLFMCENVFGEMRDALLEGREARIDGVGKVVLKYLRAGRRRDNLREKYIELGERVKLKFKTYPTMRKELQAAIIGEEESV